MWFISELLHLDKKAYLYTRTGELRDAIEGLGPGEYVAGDAANSVTEHLLVPFTGSQHDDKKQDAFNFISKSVKDKNRNSIWVLGQKI